MFSHNSDTQPLPDAQSLARHAQPAEDLLPMHTPAPDPHLFRVSGAGSDAGGDRAAIAYSILASCDLAGVDPIAYLADVLPRLARDGVIMRDLHQMMPAEWKKTRASEPISAPS